MAQMLVQSLNRLRTAELRMQNFVSLMTWPVVIACGVSLLVALLVVSTQHWHGHFSMDSTFGVQKVHVHPTPRVGGVAIAAGVLVGYLTAHPDRQKLLGPILLAGIPAFIFGLAEDVTKKVGVRTRLLATMASGLLAWGITGYSITAANVPGLDWLLGFSVVSIAFTAFAVSGVANAINIIDGFNGLAAGAVIISLAAFGIIATELGDRDLAITAFILMGSVVGFLLVNWPFGKIFLGDGGAYFAGFALAWLAVLMLQRHVDVSAWAPLMVCGFPVLEVLFSIARRRRRHLSPGDPDRLHLHSLVKRRFVCRLLPKSSNLVRNSVTGAIMWLAALLPAAIAVQFPTNSVWLVCGFILCAALYSAVYARLTQFRWCVSAVTLVVRAA